MNIRSIGWNCIYGGDYFYRSAGESGEYLLVLARTAVRMGKAVLPKNTLVIYDGSCEIFYSAEEEFLICDWIVFDAEGDSEFIDIAEISHGQRFYKPPYRESYRRILFFERQTHENDRPYVENAAYESGGELFAP